jgi:hypothetical protein
MNKCREEFEKWEMSNGGSGYDYEVWQAAWNARQPEAKMLDLSGVERLELSDWGMFGSPPDGTYVRYYDLQNLVAPAIGREELVDMMDGLGESDDEGKGWAVWDRNLVKLVDAIIDRIKGANK